MKLRKIAVPALVAGAVLAPTAAFADSNNTQCNTNNGVTVCETGSTSGGSNNGGNNNDGDGIVNS